MKKRLFTLVIFLIICQITNVYGETSIEISGKAAIIMDAATGRILYEKNPHEQMPMASTTKIMTALIAIENSDMDYVIKVPAEAVGIEGSSIYLHHNERVKMLDMLYGLMLRSGNDAATAIAIELGGSVEGFAKLMNKKANELGANNTNFMNPHGLHHSQHYTTAYDLALITKAALRKPIFKEIVSAKLWVANRNSNQYFLNKNKILRTCEGGDGVKTGFTRNAGRCLVASSTRENMQLIAVTLNDGDWFNTAKALLNYAFDNYYGHTVYEKGHIIDVVEVIDGKKNETKLITSKDIIIPLKKEEVESVRTEIIIEERIVAPILRGQRVGRIITYLNDEVMDVTYLLIGEDIDRITFRDRLVRFFRRRS